MVRIIPVDRLTDEDVKEILTKYRKITLVGESPKPERDANKVMRCLIEHGYEVYPVKPHYEGVLGRKCYSSVLGIPDEVEIVDIFVRPEFTMDSSSR